jgi:tripartite-type tricarboxylate transporter receptor subunit TctC
MVADHQGGRHQGAMIWFDQHWQRARRIHAVSMRGSPAKPSRFSLAAIVPIVTLSLAITLRLGVPPASSQDYPSRPIKIIVPVAPGGLVDILPRIFGQRVTESTSQPVIVENHPGAGGSIAAAEVSKSPPDGYTLMMGFHAVLAILPHLSSKLPYDAAKGFAPIVHVLSAPNILVVHPSLPIHSAKELIAYAKANPGRLTFASSGIGSVSHIAGEQLKELAGIEIVHVPYKGPTQAAQDVVAGHVSMMFDAVPLSLESLRAGKVRALAVTSSQRVDVIQDVPTMAEAGIVGLEGGIWFGLVAPVGTPLPVVAWLNREANRVFGTPEVRLRFLAQGASMPLGTPDAFGGFIAAESQRYGAVIRRWGIRID